MKRPLVAIIYPTMEELARAKATRLNARDKFEREVIAALCDGAPYNPEDLSLCCESEEITKEEQRALLRLPGNKKNFLWVTHKEDILSLDEMHTPHLFYTLRMLFNHIVPPVFRVLGAGESLNRYRDIAGWSMDYIEEAITALTNELRSRDDLEDDLKDQWNDLQANARAIVALGL